MADKTFNEEPMITVVSDSIDPRVKRQLQSQLQSVLKSVSEVNAELENQKALESVKKQKDAVSDQSKFDDDETKPTEPAKPVEENNGQNQNPQPEQSNQSSQNQPAENTDNQSSGSNDSSSNPFEGGNGEGGQDPFNNSGESQPTDNNQQQEQPPAQNQPNQQQNQQSQQQPQEGQAGNQPAQNTNNNSTNQQGNTGQQNEESGDDPFSDKGVNFESFAGMLGFNYKAEDRGEDQTDDPELPPIKVIVYIKCGDQGVDNRTSGTVATIEDPQNAVVILDQADVSEVEAKMEFKALTKQLQTRGVMVFETVDEAIEYLNNVYDEITGSN